MGGRCMACRYKIKSKERQPRAAIRGNINVSRLPVPRLPATKPCRVDISPSKIDLTLIKEEMREEAKLNKKEVRTSNSERIERIGTAAQKRRFYTPEIDAEIMQMHAAGRTKEEIALKLGKTKISIEARIRFIRRQQREKTGEDTDVVD